MCPLRFILVFFSAVLAGYVAWKTVKPSSEPDLTFPDDSSEAMVDNKQSRETGLAKMIQNGFWVFVDMASGRYLWKNIKQLNEEGEETKST